MKAFVYCAVGDVRFKRESMYSIATLHPYLEHSLGEYRILIRVCTLLFLPTLSLFYCR